MATKPCKEQYISFSNNVKQTIFYEIRVEVDPLRQFKENQI